MRSVKFKNPDSFLNVGGQVIHPGNITPEKYDELVAIAPAHADHFIIEELKEEVKADKAKDTKAEKP